MVQITGDSLFLEWFPQWTLDLAQKHGAVIVSPNYRLMPEATSADIFEDMEDFWTWLHLPTALEFLSQNHNLQLDLSRILTAGESAGGFLSISLALSHPHDIRACTASYPCVDLTSDHFVNGATTPPMGVDLPASLMADYVAQLQPGAIVTSAFPPDRFDLALGATRHGQITALYERDVEGMDRAVRYPFEKLERADTRIPVGGIAMLHGLQDDVVPVEGCERFAVKAREAMKGRPGGNKIVFSAREGGHGFDGLSRLEEPWLLDNLKFAVEAWLEYPITAYRKEA